MRGRKRKEGKREEEFSDVHEHAHLRNILELAVLDTTLEGKEGKKVLRFKKEKEKGKGWSCYLYRLA